MASTYDFIVVGSGPAGSTVAAGLARSAKSPKVLLLEAGGVNDDKNLRIDGQRWITFMNKHMNWGYSTTPQEGLDNRSLDYSRGLGMGGSSAINFGVYTVGARDDYEEWARVVGDDAFRWGPIQSRFKSLETFHGDLPAGLEKKFKAPNPADHGTSGPLHVGFTTETERDLPDVLDVYEKAGFPFNNDHNSGNPIGMSLMINSAHKGLRSTAADILEPRPENLTIITQSPVQRLILEGKRAVGVESNGKKYFASKEVILSAGSLDSPKILMHSGIGPAKQLEKYKIPVVQPVEAIGKGLRDHTFSPLVYKRKEGTNDRHAFYGDQKAMDKALEQWKKDGTGPWAQFACELGVGWFKIPRLQESKEFQELPEDEKQYLTKETIPHYEFMTHVPIHWLMPGFPKDAFSYSCFLVFLFNAQARGEVTLQSSDPDVPLLFDPKFLQHPFDRRAAIESMRDAFRVAKHAAYTKDNVIALAEPKSDSDEDILEYWRQTMSSSWHMTGTVKMGKLDDQDAVVDSNFKVKGIEGLRVADMSVVPVLASCHVQAVAYVTGATAAEKLIKEYGLA
ncbi:CAZyme family AA3 [Paecilomyces variotii]|nr:CAZyme family AA3 [Paecilomyces variotii]KAJ9314484.1 CAZyme family AA3 [Paecilomyces variotii]KAJ9379534.1 CAZyme family AA3 [Paecilomyces variotii]